MSSNVASMQDARELEARRDLAAAHRLAVRHGLNEGVWNHISLVSPADPDLMLITPGHTHWSQVRASTLALMNPEGEMLSGERPPIRAGWIIHRPVHRARADAICVVHVHAPYITAMSIRKDVLFETRSSQQSAAFHGDVVYYDVYDGVLSSEDEGDRMAETLGDKRVLLLRNHGALVVGSSVARAYLDVYQLERACMYQLLAMAGGGEMQLIPEDVAAETARLSREGRNTEHFEGMKRWIAETEPDYAQ
ncbi:MAG: class II aldolase/adducin family protein [Alphaproteobacteria bacterium]|nr:class II aldolase/adducin family protein [Alphaproteobacteria bacterium]